MKIFKTNVNWPRLVFATILVSACLAGCVNLKQPPGKINFYTLEYDPPDFQGLATLPVNLCVNRFSVVPAYNTHRIIYREKPFMGNAYMNHRWRANPGDFMTFFFARDLSASGLFNAAFAITSQAACTHVVEGMIDEFFELDEEDTWTAVVSVGITLLHANEPDISKRILFQKRYSEKEPCKRKHPRALAAAMSVAVSRISEAVIRDIHAGLNKQTD